jgi:hypothetical protein
MKVQLPQSSDVLQAQPIELLGSGSKNSTILLVLSESEKWRKYRAQTDK